LDCITRSKAYDPPPTVAAPCQCPTSEFAAKPTPQARHASIQRNAVARNALIATSINGHFDERSPPPYRARDVEYLALRAKN
jgi:hypothetical protein